MRKITSIILLSMVIALLSACSLLGELVSNENNSPEEVTALENLVDTENFRPNALEHILEGELNSKGQAVGFHYDHLPTKKGEIIAGTETAVDDHGVYEAEVSVEGVEKTSNGGRSTFFPNDWDSQDVVDAINEAFKNKEFINGNTYEGLTDEGIVVRMYLDNNDKIISAFPVYEG